MTSKCCLCQAVGDDEIVEGGIYIGLYEDINENRCHICQGEIIETETTLSSQESKVEALKQQGKSRRDISEILGIPGNQYDMVKSRIREKKRRARNTLEFLE